jgi:hypothetical protein
MAKAARNGNRMKNLISNHSKFERLLKELQTESKKYLCRCQSSKGHVSQSDLRFSKNGATNKGQSHQTEVYQPMDYCAVCLNQT